MAANVKLEMSADGKPIAALQKLIAQRIQYTNESAREALAACAIQVLISLRADTAVAKAPKIEVSCDAALYPSFRRVGKVNIPCLRYKGSGARFQTDKPIIWPRRGVLYDFCQVYTFFDIKRGSESVAYFIVAPDAKSARARAQEIVNKRLSRYKGLARLALGRLMNKASQTSQSSTDNATPFSQKVANEVSQATAYGTGSGAEGAYSLTCEDNLDYATLALKGGPSAVDMAAMKAANKIASVIRRKIGDEFFHPVIDTPFPELRRNK